MAGAIEDFNAIRDRPTEGMKCDWQNAPSALVARARAITEVCAAYGTTLPAAVITVPYTHPSIINPSACGLRNRSDETWNTVISESRTVSGTISALRG